MKRISLDSRHFNPGPPDKEACVLVTLLRLSVIPRRLFQGSRQQDTGGSPPVSCSWNSPSPSHTTPLTTQAAIRKTGNHTELPDLCEHLRTKVLPNGTHLLWLRNELVASFIRRNSNSVNINVNLMEGDAPL